MVTEHEAAYHELLFYTLDHAGHDPYFIHQLGVDAWAAQHADERSKTISVAFALIGLYLHVEKGYTGKQVQDAHVQLARQRQEWPSFIQPDKRGEITVLDVLAAPAGHERDAMIRAWCGSVWDAWEDSHEVVARLVKEEMGE